MYYVFIETDVAAGPFTSESEAYHWIDHQNRPAFFHVEVANPADMHGFSYHDQYEEVKATSRSDVSDWHRKEVQDQKYAHIPYGLRQQMGLYNQGSDQDKQACKDAEAPKLAAIPSLALVGNLYR